MSNPISPTAVAAVNEEEEEDEVELDPQTIDFLKTCSPRSLAHQLSKHRQGNPSDISSLLQQAYQHAEKAALQVAMSQPADTAEDADMEGGMLLEEPLETSLVTPRMGKVSIQLSCSGGLLATRLSMNNSSQQAHLHLPPGSVSHLIIFPKPEDCKLIKMGKLDKVKGHVVLLKLKTPLPFQGKDIDQVCFALPWDKNDGCTLPKLTDASENHYDDDESTPAWKKAADAWRRTLTQALQSLPEDDDDEDAFQTTMMKVSQVRVNSTVFTSHIEIGTSTTTSGMPYVSCNRGVQDGVLYPLKQGLLFFKPPKFIPVTDMQAIEFSRGRSAGQSSSRYVDFGVVLRPANADAKVELEEFTNILSQEEGPLKEYHQEYILPFLQKETEDNDSEGDEDGKPKADVQAEAVEDTDDDSDEDDDDFDQGEDDDEDEEDGEETDNEDGGIQVVADDYMKELKENANKRKDESSGTDTDEPQSETEEVMDEDGNPIKRRKSKRLKRH